jgi:trigger factor
MAPDQFAQALVQANQVPMAIQDIRRGKALAAAMKQVSVVDADGNAVDLEALEAELNQGFAEAE